MNIYYRTPMPIGDQLQALKDLPIAPLSYAIFSAEWTALCVIPHAYCWDPEHTTAKDVVPKFSGSVLSRSHATGVVYVDLPFDLFLELCHLAVITNYFLAVEMLKDRLSAFH